MPGTKSTNGGSTAGAASHHQSRVEGMWVSAINRFVIDHKLQS
ncbi:hypothetical protein [Mesorhizobium sp. LSJC280B00]|nr:hypothetical protein [Mesorhizobium sp. LSJC280B00]